MAYSWFRTDSSIAGHPKEREIAALLNDNNALAYVTRLHCWTQLYAPSGDFPKTRAARVEAFCLWPGPPGALMAAFVKIGWIDARNRRFFVHDWPELQGKLVEKSERDKAVKRAKRAEEKAKRGKTARAGRAPGAPTDGRTDGRTRRSLEQPPVTHAVSVAVDQQPHGEKKDWGPVVEQLVARFLLLRQMKFGHLPLSRTSDVANLRDWLWSWCLKYEPEQADVEMLERAVVAFLEDPNAPDGRSFSVWCSDNVGLDRYDQQRADANLDRRNHG